MSQPARNHDPTEDPAPVTTGPRCWMCQRSGATGKARLGLPPGALIPVCPTGTGCQDGRVRHGPPHDVEPHWPDEDCPVCSIERQREMQNARTQRRRGSAGNRSRRHR